MSRKSLHRLSERLPLARKLTIKRWLGRTRELGATVPATLWRTIAAKLGRSEHELWRREQFSIPSWKDSLLPHSLTDSIAAIGSVRTSIIIPIFNKVDYTFQCLRSVLEEVELAETEVIVVDNASTDETSEALQRFGNLVLIVSNATNEGFVDACNRGAGEARGEYLVFLNNDTVVQPGWLTNLLDTIENDESIGAAGSLFLYPNGRIQEAGGIIWQSGHAYHYGWGSAQTNRKYLFRREVDYCSGASLLIRKSLFAEIGGFDRRFAPAYYEDADLCMSVRAHGKKVIYQPASRLVHFEGATAGRDVNAGLKQYQVTNREVFAAKWAEVLKREHLPEDQRNRDAAAQRNNSPSVIVFDDRVPTPDRDAGSARMLAILRSLARHYRPVFVYLSDPLPGYEEILWKDGIETSDVVDYPRLLKQRTFHAAIISRPHVAAAVLKDVRRRAPAIRIIFDMVDAHFLRLGLEHELRQDVEIKREAERYKKLELALARASDLIWCNSSADQEAMANEAPGVASDVIPTIHSLQPRGRAFAERRGLLFIGNFSHRPNRDALQYFLNEIFPMVQEQLPEIRLDVIGGNADEELLRMQSEFVKLHGFVPQLAPFIDRTRLLVAPLRFGAGVKGKIGEALAHGLPVVTSSVGAEGMALEHGTHAMIADTPAEFANAVSTAYQHQELWQRLSDNGYHHVEKFFSPPVVEEIILRGVRGDK